VFPFRTLVFALHLIMVDLCFITRDTVMQKGVSFLLIPVLKAVKDVQTVMCMVF
jgi:hypothetical protein